MHCPQALDDLRNTFSHGTVVFNMPGASIESICEHLIDDLIARGKLPARQRQHVLTHIHEREQRYPAAIGHAVAVAIAHLDSLKKPLVAFARLEQPIDLGAPDRVHTQFVYLLLGNRSQAERHLGALATIARVMSDDRFRAELHNARSRVDLSDALGHYLHRRKFGGSSGEIAVPPGLESTRRLGAGLAADLHRRLKHYASDFTDGLHPKSINAVVFLFFACLAPAITFGGLMSEMTNNMIGVTEMIVGTAVCGIVYGLTSGQPLTILGGTGPLLIFTAVLFDLCKTYEVDFLATYGWVGLWTMAFTVLLSVCNASGLIRFVTRFTDEIFAVLMSIIFIYEAVKALVQIFTQHQVQHDTAFLSLLLALGTFYVASRLKHFRRSRYLHRIMREFVADFGSVIAIASMSLVAYLFHQVDLVQILVPDTLNTTSGRPWLVDLTTVPMWVMVGSAVPALLATVLIYLCQNLSTRIINARHHRLRKGSGYHLDLLVVGLLIGVCSFFGLPWFVAAVVRSLNHVHALATVEEQIAADGTIHIRTLGVRENRLTATLIHVCIACSLLLLPLLHMIPMSVLYGLFLFMGFASLSNNQFVERLKLWLMDPARYPTTHYIRKVPMRAVHIFTFVQAFCLIGLAIVMYARELIEGSDILALCFPFFVCLLIPVRVALGRILSSDHFDALNSEETPEEELDREAGG